jgi:endoribonuclease Dicer
MYGDEVGTVADEEPIASIDPSDFRLHNALVPRPTPEIISPKEAETSNMRYFPISLLRTTKIPLEFFQTFSLVPSLNRHFIEASVTGALSSTFELPPINTRLLATAITAPMSQVGYDYQSLEFVGDAALQLATSVHVFLQHPKADEERLSILRSNSVDNRFLRRFALECGLSKFLLPHLLRPTTFVPETSDDATQSEDGLLITETIGRRLLSDTLEALLGATVIDSGFNGAMHVTARLGLCTGGTVPWSEREPAQALLDVPRTRAGSGLQHLEAAIGYSFQTQGQLLRRALTHRSWVEDSGCYEREEFLGDAILEWWATTRLYALGPDAPPSALTFARALLVSSGALALIGCRKLELHKCILHSSPVLEAALHEAAEQAQQYSFEQVVQGDLTFLWSPPKVTWTCYSLRRPCMTDSAFADQVISDVVEAILAAVFIDAGFQLEPVLQVLDRLFADIMPHVVLTTEVRDPYSRFLMLLDSLACKSLSVK